MSVENAQTLASRCVAEAAVAERIEAAGTEGFAAQSEALGLACNVAEFEEALGAVLNSSAELSDEQLGGISGGKIGPSDTPDVMMSLLSSLKASSRKF